MHCCKTELPHLRLTERSLREASLLPQTASSIALFQMDSAATAEEEQQVFKEQGTHLRRAAISPRPSALCCALSCAACHVMHTVFPHLFPMCTCSELAKNGGLNAMSTYNQKVIERKEAELRE